MSRLAPVWKRMSRRGSNAVEFALVTPLLVLMLAGTVNWGYYLFLESAVANAYRHGSMVGMMSTQTTAEKAAGVGGCAACISDANAAAESDLSDVGITVTSGNEHTSMCYAPGASGTCAVKMAPTITFTPLMSILPMPATYSVKIVMFAANVKGCATAC